MLVEIVAILVLGASVWCVLNSDKQRLRLQAKEGREIKPYGSIPGPWGVPLVGSFWLFLPGRKYEGKFHNWMVDMVKDYGPIMKQNLFGLKLVMLSDPTLIEEMIRKDGKYPTLFLTAHEANNAIRIIRKEPLGIVTRYGNLAKVKIQ